MNRTTLEWARDIARSYRSALHAVDPSRCAQLDAVAQKKGQHWIAPTEIPAEHVDEAMDAKMRAVDIAHFWGIPASTIRTWAQKGLLEHHCADDGSPLYLVRDVLDAERRNRVKESKP